MSAQRSNLRILHVCPQPSFSGLEAYALQMAEHQHHAGHQVEMVVLPNSPLEKACSNAGVVCRHKPSGIVGWYKYQRDLVAAHRSAPFDIIHLHTSQELDPHIVPLWRLKRANSSATAPRVILQTHIWISSTKKDPLHAWSYGLVDEVWCSSGPAKANLELRLPVNPNKIRVIKYGRPVAKMKAEFLSRAEARAQFKLPAEAVVYGNVARIDPGKGTRELVEAIAQIMISRTGAPSATDLETETSYDPSFDRAAAESAFGVASPIDNRVVSSLHLVIIGDATADLAKAHGYFSELKAFVEKLPSDISKRIHFAGAIANSYQFLRAFDIFCLPTYQECFSLALLEAQLAGLPCVATDAGGSPEVVIEPERQKRRQRANFESARRNPSNEPLAYSSKHSTEVQTGWLCEPRSADSLRRALMRSLAQKSRWPELGAKAKLRVEQSFDSETLLPEVIDMYRSLLLPQKI
jgi:glycosyltransferase involved in cell wall biosynthesis